ENYALVLRYPLTSRGSIETGFSRRFQTSTDLINIGQERLVFTEERVLSAERVGVGIGWRRRWKGVEAGASGRDARPNGSHDTDGAFHITTGDIWGGGLEARARLGAWTLFAAGERESGSLSTHEENRPDFAGRNFDEDAVLESYRMGVGWEIGKRDFFFQAAYDRSTLPFVSLAVLGTEVNAFEAGYHPSSRAKVWLLGV